VSAYDLFVAGRPSVDVMFSGLEQWPELGNDVDAAALGACAGTSFNTPAAANRIGLRVAYVAEIGNDVWSRMIHEEFEAERLRCIRYRSEDTLKTPPSGAPPDLCRVATATPFARSVP